MRGDSDRDWLGCPGLLSFKRRTRDERLCRRELEAHAVTQLSAGISWSRGERSQQSSNLIWRARACRGELSIGERGMCLEEAILP